MEVLNLSGRTNTIFFAIVQSNDVLVFFVGIGCDQSDFPIEVGGILQVAKLDVATNFRHGRHCLVLY